MDLLGFSDVVAEVEDGKVRVLKVWLSLCCSNLGLDTDVEGF